MLTKLRVVECLSMYFYSDQRRANCFTLVQININVFDIVRDLKYPLRQCYSTKSCLVSMNMRIALFLSSSSF